jgi:hypothetical protein
MFQALQYGPNMEKVSYGATYSDNQSFQVFSPLPEGKHCRKWCPRAPA